MIWKLEGGRIHLIPTSHFLSPRDYPIRRECSRVYSKSDVLVFECDWWAPGVQPLPCREGEAFGDAGDEFRIQVEKVLATLGINKDSLTSNRPEFVSMIISTRVAELHGCFFADGLDACLRNRALANGKGVRFLESPTATNELLDTIPFDQRLADLRRLVENVDLSAERFQRFIDAYRTANTEELAALQGLAESESPMVMAAVIYGRSRSWLPEILRMHASSDRAAICVGAFHCFGEQGLPNLIANEGIDIKYE